MKNRNVRGNCNDRRPNAGVKSLLKITAFSLATFTTVQSIHAQDYTWNKTSGSTWSTAANWTPTAPTGGPNAAGIFVLINTNITANGSVTLYNTGNPGTAIKTVGRLDLGDTDGTNAFSIVTGTGGGILNFAGNGGNAQFNELSTSLGDTISAPVTLTTSLDIANASANTMTFSSGGITAASAGAKTLTTSSGAVVISGIIGNGSGTVAVAQNGSGALSLSAANTYGGGTTLTSGTITVGISSVVTSGSLASGAFGTGITRLGSGTNTSVLQTTVGSGTTRSIANNISLDGDLTFAATAATGRIALNTLYSGAGAAASFLTTPNTITLTRTNQLTVNSGMTVDLIGAISGPGFGITKLGAGTLNIGSTSTTASNLDSTANTFTGLTTVSAGTVLLTKTAGVNAVSGNLKIDGSGAVTLGKSNQINDTAMLTMAGGSFSTGGNSETLGALTLSANSSLDLGTSTTGSVLKFANSSATGTWTGILSISNYSGQVRLQDGSFGASSINDAVFFGTTSGGLTSDQLGSIQFVNPSGYTGTFGAYIDGNGEVYAAVPEPTTILGGVALLGLIVMRERRRFGTWKKLGLFEARV